MSEILAQFEKRKKDHIRIALDPKSQAINATGESLSGLSRIKLIHEALPELNFSEIEINKKILGQNLNSPIFISSMTAGHEDGIKINQRMAKLAESKKWMMGVGSQRKELSSPEAAQEWKTVRASAPNAILCGNLGLAQVIQTEIGQIEKLIENLQAKALFVHLNPLQEVLQPEGTPNFKGGLQALEKLVKKLSVPVLIKEVGCGISSETLKKLNNIGVFAVDVAGLGGTHWGRVETARLPENDVRAKAAESFANWGIPTVESVRAAVELSPRFQIWASGGVRSGLDVAKLLAMGAQMVGVAMPIINAALQSEEALLNEMERFELELKISMFCTGVKDLEAFSRKKVWEL
jgi:isopentenyl-diphosphate delta-isomerase